MTLRIIVNDGRDKPFKATRGDRAMGGLQSACLGLCTAFARRGHEVHLFARCPRTGSRNGVNFHDRCEMATFTERYPPDVFVAIPETLPLLLPIAARARVIWSHASFADGDHAIAVPYAWQDDIGRRGQLARLYPLSLMHRFADLVVVGSQWHAGIMRSGGVPEKQLSVQLLGVPLELYGGPAPDRHEHRLIYTSRGRRGLDVLVRLFPRIKEEVPDAELHVYGYGYGDEGPPELAEAGQSVHWGGSVKKSTLAHALRSAGLMAYPCRYKETYCLAVAEAQAAGLPVVTSDLAALSERVEDGIDGFLVRATAAPRAWEAPDQADYQEAFVARTIQVLADDGLRERMRQAAIRKARTVYDWDSIATRWDEMLLPLVDGAPTHVPRIPGDLDLLNPEYLQLEDKGRSATVPSYLAETWLRQIWASYGFDGAAVPGLPVSVR